MDHVLNIWKKLKDNNFKTQILTLSSLGQDPGLFGKSLRYEYREIHFSSNYQIQNNADIRCQLTFHFYSRHQQFFLKHFLVLFQFVTKFFRIRDSN